MTYRLGVDVGGTFTDLVLIREADGTVHRAKVPSTPSDPSVAVLQGIDTICRNAGADSNKIGSFLHGTTVATNTILERSGARVGLVTTEGFRHVLQIARSHIPGGLGSWIVHPKHEPLAPLEITIEATERVNSAGDILTPLDEDQLRRSIRRLKDRSVEAITISLYNAFACPDHELRAREIIKEEFPGVPISISSEVLPEMLEYERAITTVANSYVRPKVEQYIRNLSDSLGDRDIAVPLHILRSDGGLASTTAAMATPVNLLMSGPAGGVAGASALVECSGYKNLLTVDMGGTSTDVALIENGVPRLRRETTVGDIAVKAPSLDIRSVGAGGGSIAHVPELTGALRVGPQSAGADPGPAAYGIGGSEPTVTDANLVLGYLPSSLLGGEMQLDVKAAQTAVAKVAKGLSLDIHEAAAGIIAIVNESMFGALRLVSIQQGYDPRDFALVAFGGAGPLHANALAALIGSWPVIIPPSPGVLCAYGDAATSLRDEASRTLISKLEDTSLEEIVDMFLELGKRASASLVDDGVPTDQQALSFEADCRYAGQGLLLPIKVELDALRRSGLGLISEAFDIEHDKLFHFRLSEPHEIVNLRAIAVDAKQTVEIPRLKPAEADSLDAALVGESKVWVSNEEKTAKIYDRTLLLPGHRIAGPAIVTEMDSTTLILPGHGCEIDNWGSLIITPDAD